MAVNISTHTQADILNRYCVEMASEISTNLKQMMVSEGIWTPVITDHTYASTLLETSGDIVQAYQCAFTPPAVSGTIYQNKWSLQPMKIDLEWSCDDLIKWFNKWKCEWDQRGKNVPLTQWDFPRWIFKNEIYPTLQHDMEMKVAFNAEAVTPTTGVAGTTIGAVDGMGTVIKDAIVAGAAAPTNPINAIAPSNVISTEEFTESTIYDKLTAFLKAIPVLHRNQITSIQCAPELVEMYAMDVMNRFGNSGCCDLSPITNDGLATAARQTKIFPFNVTLQGLPSMTGSQRIIASSMKNNLIWGRKRGESVLPTMQWESQKRVLSAFGDFHRFYGFEDGRRLFVNEQV